MLKSKYDYIEIEKELLEYINLNAKDLLRDKEAPIMDKIAIISLKFGTEFFKKLWNGKRGLILLYS